MFGNSDEYNLPSEGLQSRKYGILRRFVKMTVQLSVRHGVDFPRQRFCADQKERRRQPPDVAHAILETHGISTGSTGKDEKNDGAADARNSNFNTGVGMNFRNR
jgi:hypothetical protein